MNSTRDYFRGLNEYVGGSWNRFWFEPDDAFGIGVLRIAIGLMALIWHYHSRRNWLIGLAIRDGLSNPSWVESFWTPPDIDSPS